MIGPGRHGCRLQGRGARVTKLPSYDELPVMQKRPRRSSWGIWGDGDVFGCLNLQTPERIRDAVRLVRRGAMFPLNFELELPDPPLFGRPALEHTVHGQGTSHDDELSHYNPQSSSQWDGFRHVGHVQFGFYNGVADEEHGIHHWARRGIAGRAVLADVGLFRAAQGRELRMDDSDPIEPSDILGTLESQNVRVDPGDVLLIRTGWIGWYRALDAAGRTDLAANLKTPGLRPGDAMAQTLWDLHIAAVAADNPALEVWPPGAVTSEEMRKEAMADQALLHEIFLHFSLLPLLGMPIGELWDLEALAEDCASDGVYECFLTSAPLNVRQSVGATPNAIAFK